MVDREARDALAAALRSSMDAEMGYFVFDEAKDAVWRWTEDQTVRLVAEELGVISDDICDFGCVASRGEWKHLNRLLLLLDSEGELESGYSPREWHWSQLPAAMLLAGFVVLWRFGDIGFFLCAAFFGPPSILLAWLGSRGGRKEPQIVSPALEPFGSFGGLRRIRRSVPGFARRRYPRAVREKGIWSQVFDAFMWILCHWLWCVLSPLVLLVQMLPQRDPQTRVWLGEVTGTGDQSLGTWSPNLGSER